MTNGRDANERTGGPGATVAAQAYVVIRAMIMDGVVQPGERLKEEDLTERCGVSRTPVREALRRLSAEGLVTMTPRQGAEVVAVDFAELEEIFALRAMVERHAASRAATRVTPDQIVRLKRLALEMEEAVEDGREAMEQRLPLANAEFHAIILEAAASPRLVAMAALVVQLPLTLRAFASYSEEDRVRSLRHHAELISAFEARSPQWAASVMDSHIHAALFALVRDGPVESARSGLEAAAETVRSSFGGKPAGASKHRRQRRRPQAVA